MDMKTDRTRVFVYGTLKQGQANHSRLLRHNAEFVDYAKTDEGWALIDLGPFPAMIRDDNYVYGEVWEVDMKALPDLDRLEGAPVLYRRYKIPMNYLNTSDEDSAWVYVLAQRGGPYTPEQKMGVWP
jgi:gamma-glutamylcyclotransferase (GGCT)/AIG2-like uncharacterized protein YtfP